MFVLAFPPPILGWAVCEVCLGKLHGKKMGGACAIAGRRFLSVLHFYVCVQVVGKISVEAFFLGNHHLSTHYAKLGNNSVM